MRTVNSPFDDEVHCEERSSWACATGPMDSSTTTMATPETRKKASAIDRQKRHNAVRYRLDRQGAPG